MGELEARIRVGWSTGAACCLEVAIADRWSYNRGCYEAQEAYIIFYYKERDKGKIVESTYKSGPVMPEPKTDINSAPLIDIPKSIIDVAFTPIFAEGTPEKFRKPEYQLQAFHFKPLSKEDWMYIKNNCFHPT